MDERVSEGKISRCDRACPIHLFDKLGMLGRFQAIEEVYRTSTVAATYFTFTHALIHSTLLSNLSTLRRHRLQRQVALVLEQAYPERLADLAPLLGRYFAEAGESDKAIHYLLQAGDDARRVYAYDEAINAYEQALIFLKEVDDYQGEARTLMKLALAYHNTLAFDRSREAYDAGFVAWQRLADEGEIGDHEYLPAPHPFRIAVPSPPPSLDPSFYNDEYSGQFITQILSGLLERTMDNELIPDIARSWEVLDEGTRYIFHLRDEVIWSDAMPVTADDFAFAWKRKLDPQNQSGLPQIIFDIKGAQAYHEGREIDPDTIGVHAQNELTLVVDLERPSGYFLQIMANGSAFPVPKQAIEKSGARWTDPDKMITNGPYKIASWAPESSLMFERNPDYHRPFAGNVTQVELVIAPQQDNMLLYEQDRIDFVGLVDSDEGNSRAIQDHPEEYISKLFPMTTYIAFDTRRAPFTSPAVRKALALAFDRDLLISQATKGMQFPALGGYVAPGIPGHVPGIALPYDPELARRKLAEAGYANGQGFPSVAVQVVPLFISDDLVLRITEQWQQNLGIHIAIEIVTFDELLANLKTDVPIMWFSGWSADYPDPDSFLRLASWIHESGWRHAEYEALIQDARGLTAQDQRMAMYRQAERILVEEAPIIPLSYARYHALIKSWVRSLPQRIPGGFIFRDTIIDPH